MKWKIEKPKKRTKKNQQKTTNQKKTEEKTRKCKPEQYGPRPTRFPMLAGVNPPR
jgi:hypothetical protein